MSERITNLLAACGDGNPTINISAADAHEIGLAGGQHTANDIRKALAGEPAGAAPVAKADAAKADEPAKKTATRKTTTKS